MTRKARRQCGFTLIEVMVALVIAALALGGVMASISQKVDAGRSIRDRTYASWIGQNKITELRLQNVVPKVSESNGEVEYGGVEWGWQATISETGVENLFRVDVEVSFAGSDDMIWRSSGFVGEPGVPGESNRAWNVGGEPVGNTN